MLVASVDWTPVLVALIPAVPATIAALRAGHIRKAIRTPSGEPIGRVAERAHETGIANNLLLRRANGPTKQASGAELREAAESPVEVPFETDLHLATEEE